MDTLRVIHRRAWLGLRVAVVIGLVAARAIAASPPGTFRGPVPPHAPPAAMPTAAICTASVRNDWAFSAVTVTTDYTWNTLSPGDSVEVPVYGPTPACIWECIWNGSAYDCRWDCAYTLCPQGRYGVRYVGPAYDLTLVTKSPGFCADCAVVPARRSTWGMLKQLYR